MASNLSTIGFSFTDDADFESTMVRLANDARERLATDAGEYAVWRSRTGAEIWFHLGAPNAATGERDIIGLTPFFEGESDVALAVTAAMQRPEDNPLEGLLHAWVGPDDTGIGSYPIVFEAVDYAAHEGRALPAEWRCRIACFCRDISIFDSVEAMAAADTGEQGQPLAAQSLIPIGLFADNEADDPAPPDDDNDDGSEDTGQPQPTVLMRGIVRAHRRLQNEITGGVFHWMLVETLDATLDVLADEELIEREVMEGSAIEAYAYVFGRALS